MIVLPLEGQLAQISADLCLDWGILWHLLPYLHAEETRHEDAHNPEDSREEQLVHSSAVLPGIFLQRARAAVRKDPKS